MSSLITKIDKLGLIGAKISLTRKRWVFVYYNVRKCSCSNNCWTTSLVKLQLTWIYLPHFDSAYFLLICLVFMQSLEKRFILLMDVGGGTASLHRKCINWYNTVINVIGFITINKQCYDDYKLFLWFLKYV